MTETTFSLIGDLPGLTPAAKPFKWAPGAAEYRVVALRECPLPDNQYLCDTPERAAQFWREHIAKNPYIGDSAEALVVLLVNCRRRVKGMTLVSLGTLDTCLVHPREVFRVAIISSASAIIVMHNHPSGDPIPSEADIKVTRDLIRAGQLLKIEVLDHVIVGAPDTTAAGKYSSLRELGYFYS